MFVPAAVASALLFLIVILHLQKNENFINEEIFLHEFRFD